AAPSDAIAILVAPPSVDLGVGSYWKNAARGAGAADAVDRGAAIARGMRDELAARDLDMGIGPTGDLVAAAAEGASPAVAPGGGGRGGVGDRSGRRRRARVDEHRVGAPRRLLVGGGEGRDRAPPRDQEGEARPRITRAAGAAARARGAKRAERRHDARERRGG